MNKQLFMLIPICSLLLVTTESRAQTTVVHHGEQAKSVHNKHQTHKPHQFEHQSKRHHKDYKKHDNHHYYGHQKHKKHKKHVSYAYCPYPHHHQNIHWYGSVTHHKPVSYHHRHYGHKYPGYGFYYSDSDALKWLGFTAITLSLLDNLSEHAQRQHEAAQIKATSMPVGEPIVWHSGNASGEVVTTREGRNQAGQKCREYQQTLFIDGKSEKVVGTACLAEDGRWQVVANSN
jgi:hypothetical protein